MKGLLRKIRGILGTGLTWAVGWGVIFAGIFVTLGYPLGLVGIGAARGAILGAFAGGSFAVILSITEGRRTLRELSLWRVALWGGIGGAALLLCLSPLVLARISDAGLPISRFLAFLVQAGISGALGAGFAAGSVALAKREDRRSLPQISVESLASGSR